MINEKAVLLLEQIIKEKYKSVLLDNKVFNEEEFYYEFKIDEKISNTKSIDTILKNAQTIFNEWSKLEPEERTSQELLNRLNTNFDFFKLLDSVTIARSRKHIEKYYNMSSIGKFPTRLKPISISSELTNIEGFMSIKEIAETLSKLNMCVYAPFDYILPTALAKYEDMYDISVKGGQSSFRQADRERSLQILMRINFLKRLESSVESFRLTLNLFNPDFNFPFASIKKLSNFPLTLFSFLILSSYNSSFAISFGDPSELIISISLLPSIAPSMKYSS